MEFEVTAGSCTVEECVSHGAHSFLISYFYLMISANLAQLSSVEMRLNLSEVRMEQVNRHNAGIVLSMLEN